QRSALHPVFQDHGPHIVAMSRVNYSLQAARGAEREARARARTLEQSRRVAERNAKQAEKRRKLEYLEAQQIEADDRTEEARARCEQLRSVLNARANSDSPFSGLKTNWGKVADRVFARLKKSADQEPFNPETAAGTQPAPPDKQRLGPHAIPRPGFFARMLFSGESKYQVAMAAERAAAARRLEEANTAFAEDHASWRARVDSARKLYDDKLAQSTAAANEH